VINTSLLPVLHRFKVMVKFLLAREECLTLTLSLGWLPASVFQTKTKGDNFSCIATRVRRPTSRSQL